MLRLGLCCIFKNEPVKFSVVRAISLKGQPRKAQLARISSICLGNAENLLLAVETVKRLGIGAFRINSQFFPLYTHPKAGYAFEELPDCGQIRKILGQVKSFCKTNDIRLSMHPDQFVVLSSPNGKVVANSLAELEYQAILSEMAGADVINIHLGGVYGDKSGAIERFTENFTRLSAKARKRLTLENDDISYTPSDIFPVCEKLGIPAVYDVHHHRCNQDSLSIQEATELALDIWKYLGREPYFHISSPKGGWKSKNPRSHSDFIDISDFPKSWLGVDKLTVDVEAKAKEIAVAKLKKDLRNILQ